MDSELQFLSDTSWSISFGWWVVVGILLLLVIGLRWRQFNFKAVKPNVVAEKVALRLLASHKTMQIYSVDINGERFIFVQSAQTLLQLDPGKKSNSMKNVEVVNGTGK